MQITSFNPLIVTKDAEAAIALFEDLGFVRRHTITVTASDGNDVTSVRMKHEGGFYVDIAQNDVVPADMTMIRMNVRDFDEAFDLLEEHGFKTRHGKNVESATNKSAGMFSPTGLGFDLCYHIQK